MKGRRNFLALPIPLLVGVGLLAQILPAAPVAAGVEMADLTETAFNPNQPYGGQAVKPAGSKKGGKSDGDKWAKATKDSEVLDGLFRVYKGDKTWHLQINPDQLGQQYILATTVSRGIGANFPLIGGMTLSEELVYFDKVGDKVLLYMENSRFVSTEDEALKKSIELSFAPSVIQAFKIAAENEDSLLIDIGPFLLSDYADVGTWMQVMIQDKASLDSKRSTLGKLQVFEKNMEMTANLSYSPSNRLEARYNSVADSRWIPVSIQYSFVALPEPGFVPRLRDDRIGYFTRTKMDFSQNDQETYIVSYANRWRLKKKDPAASMSEVVKPITFYMENTIPERWRPYIKEGVEEWQKAFEQVGLKNAIVCLEQPDDSTFDAADVKYSSIRWINSENPAFGAIGPSRTDPRTGEIFDADILIDGYWIQTFNAGYRRYIGPETIRESINGLSDSQLKLAEEFGESASMCMAGAMAYEAGNLLNLDMRASGALPPGEAIPDEFIGASLKFLTMHEVGHTLGLRHNFQASTSVTPEMLADPSFVRKNGLTGSVMDYSTPNIQGNKGSEHYYFSPTLGSYDYWAIRYGYTPSVAENPYQEKQMLASIAEECTQDGHQYGTDFDTYSIWSMDPRNNIFDLTSDPLAFGKQRTEYIRSLWLNDTIEERILEPGASYLTLRSAMNSIIFQYGRGLSHGLKYVGGQQVSRAHYHGSDSKAAFQPIPASKQREALLFLTEKAFAPDAFDVNPRMLDRMLSDRSSSWANNPYTSRIDYPYYSLILGLQTAILDRLMEPQRLVRIREIETRDVDALSAAELFNELTGAIWGEFGIGSANAPARKNASATLQATKGAGTRRDLQRAYVDNLIGWVLNPAPTGADDARALARLHLMRVDSACARALSAGGNPDVFEAHLLETQSRIKRALEAEKLAEG